VINSSLGDLAPVFDAMLGKAVRLCGASHAVLRIFDGKLFHLAEVHGESDVAEHLRELGPIDLGGAPGDGPLGRIMRGESVVHVAGFRDTDAYSHIPKRGPSFSE
jgi:two-component system, NtrC family, sensor kinase